MNELEVAAQKFDVIDKAPVGMCVIREDYLVLFWNRCLEDWTGVLRSKIVGADLGIYFPHLKEPRYRSRIDTIFHGGPPTIFSSQLHKHTFPSLLKNSKLRVQQTTVTALPALDGNGFYALFAIEDVTELTRRIEDYRNMRDKADKAKEDAERLAKKAEASDRIKSQFLANMSHEIRTPINSILGFADMLAETHLDKEQNEFLASIRISTHSLLGLINDILDISKIEAGKLDVEKVEFDLKKIIQEVTSITNAKVIEKGLELIVNTDSIIGYKVIGDPGRLRQVLVNLAGNAVKFTDKGKISIISKIEDESETHIKIRFAVEDEGMGIPEDKQDMIFSAFSQVDSSDIRRYGGTGLGLTISNQLVRLMGGERIFLKSSPGRGSKFFFSLNFPRGSRLDEKEEERPAYTGPERRKLYKILLVEDTPQNIKLAFRLLTKRGHTVVVAENGQLAVENVKKENFDVILMDVQMPVMDGLEATKEIRKWESDHSTTQLLNHLPIIAMTASAMKGDRERCLEAGMNGYISKPIKIKEVGKLINDIIDQSKGECKD